MDALCLLKALFGRLLSAAEKTVEQNEAYGERRENGKDGEFDRIVVSIGDLLAVPDPLVIGSMLEHLLKKVLVRQVVVEVERGALSEHDQVLIAGRVRARRQEPGGHKPAFLTVVRVLLALPEHLALFGEYEDRV